MARPNDKKYEHFKEYFKFWLYSTLSYWSDYNHFFRTSVLLFIAFFGMLMPLVSSFNLLFIGVGAIIILSMNYKEDVYMIKKWKEHINKSYATICRMYDELTKYQHNDFLTGISKDIKEAEKEILLLLVSLGLSICFLVGMLTTLRAGANLLFMFSLVVGVHMISVSFNLLSKHFFKKKILKDVRMILTYGEVR